MLKRLENSENSRLSIGSFSGKVLDRLSEKPLERVKITLKNQANGFIVRFTTNSQGEFKQDKLPPGIFEIEFSTDGYETRKLTQELSANKNNFVVSALGAPVILLTPSGTDPRQSPIIQTSNLDFSALLGRFYALVIGNNNYEKVNKLKTAETDAAVVAATLKEKYGFETKLLLNAKRQDILAAIYAYRQTLGANDNLLIYYAGHGFFDALIEEAYWIPVDGSTEENSNWISANDITKNIKGTKAKHVLIVSDSCYSGTIDRQLTQTESEKVTGRDLFLQKQIGGKSRTLLASGGNEPVSDGGGGKHSVFAKAFLTGLNEMGKTAFTANELFFDFVRERVGGGAQQTPEYKNLQNSGHESGDFVFVRKK